MKNFYSLKIRILSCTLAVLTVLFGCNLNNVQPTSNTKKIYINEIVSSNKQSLTDPDLGSPDWIEIYNPSQTALDISGYGLSDSTNDFHKFVFPEGTIIGPCQFLIVYAGDNDGKTVSTVPCTGFGLSKNGDNLYFTDTYYNLLSDIKIPALVSDVSYAKKSNGDFGFCSKPTPGAENIDTDIFDSLDEAVSIPDYSGLSITEVMPSSAADGPWIELYNHSDVPIPLNYFYLSDTATNYKRYQLPESLLQPGCYVIVYADGVENGKREYEASFKIGKNDTGVYLSGLDGTLVSSLTWENPVPNGISVLADENGNTCYSVTPTPGEINSDNTVASVSVGDSIYGGDIIINEFLRKNKNSITDSDGDHCQWVELYNRSKDPVNLSDYFLSDNENDLFKFGLPSVVVDPGAFCIIFLSGKTDAKGDEIHAPFKIGKDETKLFLTYIKNMTTDVFEVPLGTGANVSVGRDENQNTEYYAQPTPGTKNAKGFETADSIGCFNNQSVFISEVFATAKVGDKTTDWVELYNGGTTDISLAGWCLSDTYDNPVKWTISENANIPAGGYCVVDVNSLSESPDSKAFSVSSSGERLILSDNEGIVIDTFSSGYLRPGFSSGRIENDTEGNRVFFLHPTRGKKNDSAFYTGYVSNPVLSCTDLYCDKSFSLSLQSSTENSQIYYTLDGSDPSEDSEMYTGPIQISSNTVIKAVAVSQNLLNSDIVYQTFLFGEKHTIPVLAVAIDPAGFKKVSSASKTHKPEYLARASYYTSDGELGINFSAGMKAKGQGTVSYRQKSFSFSFRGGYGQKSVTYPFFDDCKYTTFYSLVIRNSGQDYDTCRIRDSFCSRIVRGMNLDYAATRPVAVYINGSYWGLYDLNEELNADYLVTHYGVNKEDVDFVKRNEYALKGSSKGYLDARAMGRNANLSDDGVFAEYLTMVDSDYCTDYIIAQTFIINSDMFNQKFWHTKDNQVRWRPVFYDLDFGFNAASSSKRNLLPAYFSESGIPSHDGSLTNLDVFVGLKKNKTWRTQFIERYVQLICTQFSTAELNKVLDEMVEEIRPEMKRHIERWGHPGTMSEWEENINTLRKRLGSRPSDALDNLKTYFKLSDSYINELVEKYS